MQTLISVFEDRSAARRAMERLVKEGFARDDVHLEEGPGSPAATDTSASTDTATLTGSAAGDAQLGDRTMASAEREVAVDRGVVERLANFFVGLFGERGQVHARRYSSAVGAGRSMLVVDARDDHEAEHAAVILHDMGATDVDDHHHAQAEAQPVTEQEDVRSPRAGVHVYNRDQQPTLRDLADQRHIRNESIMADRSGAAPRDAERDVPAARDNRVDRENREDLEARALASGQSNVDKDRPL